MSENSNNKIITKDWLIPTLLGIVIILALYKFGILAQLPIIGDFFKKTSTILIIGNQNDPVYVTVYNFLSELKLNYPINLVELDPTKISSIFDPKILDKADMIVLAYQGEYPRVLLDALSKYNKNLIVIGVAGKKVKEDSSADGWILMNFNIVTCGEGTSPKCDYDEVKLGDIRFIPQDLDNPILKKTFGVEYISEIPGCNENDPSCNNVFKIYKVGGYEGTLLLKILDKTTSPGVPYDVLFMKRDIDGTKFYFAYMDDDSKTRKLFQESVKYALNYN